MAGSNEIELQSNPVGKRSHRYKFIDDIIDKVGVFGRYQIYTCFVIQYSGIVCIAIVSLVNFGRLVPLYQCNNNSTNFDLADTNNDSYRCFIKKECENRSRVFGFFHSMAEEWDLYCDRKWQAVALTWALGAGLAVGSILGGQISDVVGRKKVVYPSIYALCIISTLSTACRSWIAFLICYFLMTVIQGVFKVATVVLIAEITDQRHRWILLASSHWCLPYGVVSLVGYLTADWRLYLIIVNFLLAPLLVFFLVFLESPRFLLYQEMFPQAVSTLNDLASDRWNRKDVCLVEEQLEGLVGTRGSTPRFLGPWHLFSTGPRARLTCLLVIYLLLLSFHASEMLQRTSKNFGNPFVDIAALGLSQIWAPFLIVALDWKFERFGRRNCFFLFLIGTFIITVIFCSCHAFVPDKILTHNSFFHFFNLLSLSFTATGGRLSARMIQLEAYPTALRGSVNGWMELSYGLGAITTQLFDEGEQQDSLNVGDWVAIAIFLLSHVVVAIWGYFAIPETKHQELHDRIDADVFAAQQ